MSDIFNIPITFTHPVKKKKKSGFFTSGFSILIGFPPYLEFPISFSLYLFPSLPISFYLFFSLALYLSLRNLRT